jgi:ABC-type spermidine/putrescine transport system permease subunit II
MAENVSHKRRSGFWFLLPIFFSIIGGIIAYFAIRDDDPKRAKSCLLLGIILFAIPLITMGVTMAVFHIALSDIHPIFDVPIQTV